MSVSGLTNSGDWRFGKGRADYKTKSAAIQQSVVTRLKSFQNDWFADTQANIDWFTILGNKDSRDVILREVQRVVLSTSGVTTIERLELVSIDSERQATISLTFTDIYDEKFDDFVSV